LDDYVSLRGAIAHRGQALTAVTKSQVENFNDFIERLAGKTGGAVNKYVKSITGKRLYK
jgi:hypothetical protein